MEGNTNLCLFFTHWVINNGSLICHLPRGSMQQLYLFLALLQQCYAAGIMDNVVFAVNCGGEAHTDTNGRRQE